jgi:integrase/recombinase XerC
VPIPRALLLVQRRWRADGLHTDQTIARMSETVNRFASRLLSTGATSFAGVTYGEVASFVTARTRAGSEPELATQHARRTAVRTLYKTLRLLGMGVGDPSLDLWLPPRGMLAARPLSDDEVMLCRASCQLGPRDTARRRAVAWALAEATAVTSEITAIRLSDLDDPAAPASVRLPGTRRHDPRTGQLSEWGRACLRQHTPASRPLQANDPLLAYGGAAPPGGAKAQASVCNAIRDVLDAAGLGDETDVRPASVRNWAGRRAYDNGTPLEQIALMLGCRSLDTAAEDIALSWRQVTK